MCPPFSIFRLRTDTKRECVLFCSRVLPYDGASLLLGQRPLSKTFHTHRGWAGSFQSGHASPECDDRKVPPTQMDGSAECVPFVSRVSLHYAATFSRCGHFFGANAFPQSRGRLFSAGT